MLAFLVHHGDLVFVGLLAFAGLSGWVFLAVWRYQWACARWRRRTGRAFPRRRAGAESGLAAFRGTLRARGQSPAVRAVAAMAAASDDLAAYTTRAERLELVLDDGRELELRGRVEVAGLPRRQMRRGRGRAFREELCRTLPPSQSWPYEDLRLEVREIRDGDEVAVFGRLERAVSEASSYREGASRSVIRSPEGSSAIVLARRRRPSAWLGGVLGVLLGLGVLAAGTDSYVHEMPGALSFIVPWQRPLALRRLRDHLRWDLRYREAAPEMAALALSLNPAPVGDDRVRALALAGRREEAIAEATRGLDEPFDRVERLDELEFREEAWAELRRVDSEEARALEVLMRVPGHRYWPARAEALARELDRVCGDDWTCAAHPRLLWIHAPHWAFDVQTVLLDTARHRSLAHVQIMLRVAGDSTVGDLRVARCRVRWLIDLGAQQLRLGAVGVAHGTVARARESLQRWPRSMLDLARDVDHLEAAAYLLEGRVDEAQAHHAECPIHSFREILGGSKDFGRVPRPLAVALSDLDRYPWVRRFSGEVAPTAEDLALLQWIVPFLGPTRVDRLATSLSRVEPGGALVRETARARALRALGLGEEAARVERMVARRRASEYGW